MDISKDLLVKTRKAYFIVASVLRRVPDIKITLPDVVLQAIGTAAEMDGVTGASNRTVRLISESSIGSGDVGNVTAPCEHDARH